MSKTGRRSSPRSSSRRRKTGDGAKQAPPVRRVGWGLRVLIGLAVILAGLAGTAGWLYRAYVAPGPLTAPATLIIARGTGLDGIASRLTEAGVVGNPWATEIGARIERLRPRAGEYLFAPGISPRDALIEMAEGRSVVHKLTIAEGLTVRRVLDEVRNADYLAGDIHLNPAEGSLLPETWHLSRGDLRDDVLARMERAMRETLDAAWAARDPAIPLKTKEQAVILASIVERETAIPAERPHVAAVFENRLRLGMKLQSDPTVIYGLSQGVGVLDRPLTHEDLLTSSPWNTYAIDGLPKTPIANPGRSSLDAVLHPADSDDLYFVADGTGGHVFARTLDQHNANVAKWRKLESARREKGAAAKAGTDGPPSP